LHKFYLFRSRTAHVCSSIKGAHKLDKMNDTTSLATMGQGPKCVAPLSGVYNFI